MSTDNAPTFNDTVWPPVSAGDGITCRITRSFVLNGQTQWLTYGIDGMQVLPGESEEDARGRAQEIALKVFELEDQFRDIAKQREAARKAANPA